MTNSRADEARSPSGSRGVPSGPPPGADPLPAVVHAWVDGWARARGTGLPREVPGGFRIEVGRPGHRARYVLAGADPAVLRPLVEDVTDPGIWLKICAPRAAVVPALTPAWELAEPQYLMTCPLGARATAPVTPPPGYRLDVSHRGDGTVEARVLACEAAGPGAGGAAVPPAASGRVALAEPAEHGRYRPAAVFDMIGTEPAHRRRGLGRVVMAALAAGAAELGAVQGILVASPDGHALYHALGWHLRSPVTAAVIPGTPVTP